MAPSATAIQLYVECHAKWYIYLSELLQSVWMMYHFGSRTQKQEALLLSKTHPVLTLCVVCYGSFEE